MEANARNLERIFDQTIAYQIPLFQRPYVWNEEDNWLPLWEDIQLLLDRHLAAGRTHIHFLGAVVFEQVSNATGSIEARQVIDGQQRLTTLQLFLIAVRDLYRAMEANKHIERFTDFTENKASRIDNKDDAFKVWPTNCDREKFVITHTAGSPAALLKAFKAVGNQRRVSSNIPDAYLFFYEKLNSWFNQTPEEDEQKNVSVDDRLETLWQVVRAHLQLVVIDLDKEDESQVIFETLNARGTQLLPGDLIKNFLFHKAESCGENVEELYNRCWRDFDDPNGLFWREEVKQGRVKRPRIDLFMQHYLSLQTQDEVRVAHIFNTFKFFSEHYQQNESDIRVLPHTPGEHLVALKNYGKVFARFFDVSTHTRLDTFLKRLAAIDTATVYPFLLEACYTLEEEHRAEFERILVLLESYLIRRMVCGMTTKQYNKIFIDIIKASSEGGRITEQGVIKYFLKSDSESARFPTDQEFQVQWLVHPIYSRLAQYKLRTVLEALDCELEHAKSEFLALPDGLQIEHLLPQKWQDNWPLELENPNDLEEKHEASQQRDKLLHSLGNLTLITNSLNPAISNAAWQAKKPEILKFSKLNLNRYFHDVDAWDEDTILKRGQSLFDTAKKIWPYPTLKNN